MVTVDDYGRIRLAHRDGLSIRAIGAAYGYSRQTIRKALKQAEPTAYTLGQPRAAPVLGAYHTLIDGILEADEHAPPKQRHTAMQVFRRLRDEQQYAGGYDAVRRYVASRRRLARETFIPLDHAPGERMEVDFGHIHVDLPEERRLVPVLLCTWGYSNAPFALALPTERVEAVLAGMVAAIEFFGAVAKQVWWDNPPTVVTQVLKGRERIYHERWRTLASHYCFEPCAC